MICFCKRLMFHVREDGQKKHLRQVLKDGPLLIRLHDSPCLGKALFQTISSQEIFQTLGKGAKGNSGDSSHDAASSKTSDGNMPYSWASPRMMARSFGWALMYLTKWGRRPSKICAQEFLQVTCRSAFLPICVEVLKAGKKEISWFLQRQVLRRLNALPGRQDPQCNLPPLCQRSSRI